MHWYSTTLLLIDIAICVAAVLIVPRRHSPAAATAWLLLVFFVPIGGVLIYWLTAYQILPKRRMKQHQRMMEQLRDVRKQLGPQADVSNMDIAEPLKPAASLAARLADMPIVRGNAAQLISDDDRTLDMLIEDIDAAEQHIHMTFYIWRDDETGLRVADALAHASNRGVDCRVLADSVGSHTWFRHKGDYMARRGVRLQAALPVGILRRRVSRLDLRNHRKIVVVDGKIAWTGSQNILNTTQNGGRKFRDMMVRLRGPIVLEIQHVFRGDWYFETNELLEANDLYSAPEECGDVCVQALPSGPNYPLESYQRLVVDALHGARDRAIMTAPYFVPDQALLQAMQVAALRGVDMSLIVPVSSDHLLVDAASHAYFDFLLDAGVTIYQHKAGLLHAKALTVDDGLALVGSANFDIRSFALNFELNMIFYGGSMAGDVRQLQETYIQGSEQVTGETWARRSALRRAGQNIAKLFSPIL